MIINDENISLKIFLKWNPDYYSTYNWQIEWHFTRYHVDWSAIWLESQDQCPCFAFIIAECVILISLNDLVLKSYDKEWKKGENEKVCDWKKGKVYKEQLELRKNCTITSLIKKNYKIIFIAVSVQLHVCIYVNM